MVKKHQPKTTLSAQKIIKKSSKKSSVRIAQSVLQRRKSFLARRPHRSFRLSQRRDYTRSLQLPGYWSFSNHVRALLWKNKWLFIKFIALYSIISWLLVGLLSQENYKLLNDTIHKLGTTGLNGQLGDLSLNLAIFSGVLSGVFHSPLSQSQQIYSGLALLLAWLTLVWLLRQIIAGHKNIRLRDGLYSAGSPLVATFLLFIVMLVQVLPFVIAIVAYLTASSVNVLGNAFFDVGFWLIELLLVTLSLYWLTSSALALVVVTLPGMYPWRALRVASDLVVGRRLRLLYRLAWLLFTLFLLWLVILIPVIFISNINFLTSVPLVPVTVLLLSSMSVVWIAAYIYVLYRKLVDDDATPA